MRTLVLGIDGYIGWSLAMHLTKRGHTVSGVDNFARRANVESVGSQSAIPILDMRERLAAFKRIHDRDMSFFEGDLLDFNFLTDVIKQTRPDSIVHLAEQPSAPFSMVDRNHAIYSQHNNIEGTLNVLYAMKDLVPECHLVKLGTMGEYGTPDIDIPEGFFEIEYRGRKDLLPFPRQPHSMYHLSKVHDSANIMFACRVWKLCSTDIMQGVVYGTSTQEMIDDSLMTRFDFDESFGTVINRYCAEAVIGSPLTPYGQGKQKRGFIDLVDSIQCLTIALENPAASGEYRVFNQLDEVYSIAELAEIVVTVAKKLGIDAEIKNLENPRTEKAEHYYKVDHENLRKLGFKPTRKIQESVEIMLKDLSKHKDRILEKREAILPKTKWYDPNKQVAQPPSPVTSTRKDDVISSVNA